MSTAPGSESPVGPAQFSLHRAFTMTPSTRTHSRGTNSKIIVFDPSTSRLSVRKRADVDTTKAIKILPIPYRLDEEVDLYLSRYPGSGERLVCRLHLGGLGWGTRLRRWRGSIDEMHVMVVPKGGAKAVEEMEEDV